MSATTVVIVYLVQSTYFLAPMTSSTAFCMFPTNVGNHEAWSTHVKVQAAINCCCTFQVLSVSESMPPPHTDIVNKFLVGRRV